MRSKAPSHVLRTLVIIAFGLAAMPAADAQAAAPSRAVSPAASEMSASLQDAFLAAAASSFARGDDSYTAEHNGLSYSLAQGGLQARAENLDWSVSLRGLGRGNSLEDVQAPTVAQTADRVEYQRGDLTEWYRNLPTGVEQGFTINAAPRGNGKLVLHLDLNTDLAGSLAVDGRGLSFATSDGRTLQYDQLKAYDANGAELDAKLVYSPSQIVIQVDDLQAAYPIVIDPWIYLEQKVAAFDRAANDYFGLSVAVSGDTALVGAQGDDGGRGSAYVFVRNDDIWALAAKLTASDRAAGDSFGTSVALDGDTALVGASEDNTGTGSAYVFVKPGGGWVTGTETAKLTALPGSAAYGFGYSVALSGDTALVGAPGLDGFYLGSAYVFVKPGGGWATGTETKRLTASAPLSSDYFGWSVALDGDTALVGAYGNDSERGSAYVFVRPGGGWAAATGTENAKLTASDRATGDEFGFSVALSGDTALAGAYGDDSNSGSVYVFVKPGGGWATGTQTAKLTASDRATGDRFGAAAALDGDTALVGAFGDDSIRGSAYVFSKPGGGWSTATETAKLEASDGAGGDAFGVAVALDGGTALIGASNDDSHAGSAYFYEPYPSELGVSASVSPGSAAANDAVYLAATVGNYGPTDWGGSFSVTAPIPAGLTYISGSPSEGSYDSNTGEWTLPDLAAGATAQLTIEATVDADSPQSITFTASISPGDSNSANDAASATLTVPRTERTANGGFESYTALPKVPDEWTASKFSSSDGKNTATKEEGTASVKISGQSGKTKWLAQDAPVIGYAGDSVTFSFYAKSVSVPSSGKCMGTVTLMNGLTKVMAKTLKCSNGSTAFKLKTVTFTAAGAYDHAIVKFTYGKASGSVYFDAASLLR